MIKKALSLLLTALLITAFVLTSGICSDKLLADENGVEDFVTRLYEICLEREPDQGGFNNWVNSLRSGRISGADAARGFVFSNEFTGKNLDSRTYVIYLYRIMFGREADDAGLAGWTSALNSGSSRIDVFNGFVGSAEWRSICASYGIDPGSSQRASLTSSTSGTDEFISRLYTGFLGRSPDPTGLNDWRQRLSTGRTTGFQAAYGFMQSPEFMARASSMSRESLVSTFYSTFLGRTPSSSEVTSYTASMSGSLSSDLQMLFLSFANSTEFINYCTGHGIIPGAGNGASIISDAEVTEFFDHAVLIGSSVTDGFNMYFNRYGRGIMGDVLVCARTSYSLLNDMTNRTSYIPMLDGTPLRARELIRQAERPFVFICMGTNDISGGVVTRYYNYLDDIRSVNPDTVIFIEACTPSLDDHPANSDINALNRAMSEYCDTHDGFYFIDVNTPLSDSTGRMASRYCSDGNVHVTYQGYAKWIEVLTEYVRQYIYEQRIAGNYPSF